MENKEKEIDILDILLDENNEEPVVLYDDFGKAVEFEQFAVIPRGEDLYAILKPITKIENVNDDEVIIFKVIEGNEHKSTTLKVEQNEEIVKSVLDEFEKLMKESR